MKHKIGFIGTGEIAAVHADSIRRLKLDLEISGGYDANPSAGQAFQNIFGGKQYADPEELIHSPDIDTVYICTRHDSHADYAAMACRYGKNVFLEKPLAMNCGQALKFYNVWKKYPVPFAVGYNMRVAPTVTKLREVLAEYKAEPEAFRVSMTGPPFMQGWAGDIKAGGGVLVCQGSHMFDLITYVMKSRIRELCVDTRWLSGQSDNLEPNGAAALIRLENGVWGTLLLHDCGNENFHTEPGGSMVNITVYSQQGTFDADAYGRLVYGTRAGLSSWLPPGTDNRIERWGYQRQAGYFAGLIDGRKTPLCTVKQAMNTVLTVDAACKSAGNREWISVKCL